MRQCQCFLCMYILHKNNLILGLFDYRTFTLWHLQITFSTRQSTLENEHHEHQTTTFIPLYTTHIHKAVIALHAQHNREIIIFCCLSRKLMEDHQFFCCNVSSSFILDFLAETRKKLMACPKKNMKSIKQICSFYPHNTVILKNVVFI